MSPRAESLVTVSTVTLSAPNENHVPGFSSCANLRALRMCLPSFGDLVLCIMLHPPDAKSALFAYNDRAEYCRHIGRHAIHGRFVFRQQLGHLQSQTTRHTGTLPCYGSPVSHGYT